MTIAFLLFGLLFVVGGITIKAKKWLWIHQGFFKRPVDVDKYTKYMGNIDIIAGIIYIFVGVMFHYFKIPDIAAFIILIIYIALIIYGEIKYRIK
jgi:hypothetical protein